MMGWLQQLVQILVPVCGLVAGLITILAALTKLIHALTKLVKEFHKDSPKPSNSPSNKLRADNQAPPAHLNGAAKNGTAHQPARALLRDLRQSVTCRSSTYIEVKPRRQDEALTNEEKGKEAGG